MGNRQTRFLLGLSVAAGFVDAISYLGLGRVFTANMTGNTVLLGVAVGAGHAADALRALAALGGFVLGAAAAVALTARRAGPWPRLSLPALYLEAAALGALVLVWATAGVAVARAVLIALAGTAMGAQSAAAAESGVPGVNTTFMTGTLLTAISRVVRHLRGGASQPPGDPRVPAGAWTIYFVGALLGGVGEHFIHAGAAAVPLVVIVGLILAVARAT